MDLHILSECFIDTKLLKSLVPPQNRYNHQRNCDEVAKHMQKQLKDAFAVGIVDRDKKKLGYLAEFELVFPHTETLLLYRHKIKHHYLIFICPAMEQWILNTADEAEISLTDFGLPTDLKQLTNITKTSKSENEDPFSKNFNDLFKKLNELQPKSIRLLQFWVKYLKKENYQVDTEYLQKESAKIIE